MLHEPYQRKTKNTDSKWLEEPRHPRIMNSVNFKKIRNKEVHKKQGRRPYGQCTYNVTTFNRVSRDQEEKFF